MEDSMKALIRWMLVLIPGLLATATAYADLKVATSLTDLASVAQFVGGKHVSAQSLCRGYEDPHFVPAKPSLMKAIQHANVFVSVGLELDAGWLPLVLPGSRNPKIQPGSSGFVDASEGIDVLEKPVGTVSRAEGDITRSAIRITTPTRRTSKSWPTSSPRSSRGSTRRTRPTMPRTPRHSTKGWRRPWPSGKNRWRPTRGRRS